MSDNAESNQESNASYGTRGPPTPDDLRDREYLYQEYVREGKSQAEVADRVGCGSSTVSRWLRHHDIPTDGPTQYPKLGDEEWLRTQHRDNERSLADIADQLGCDDSTVLHWLNRHGIETRDPPPLSGEDCPAYIDGRSRERDYGGYVWHLAREKALNRDDYECQRCGFSQIAHFDKYDRDLDVHHITPFRESMTPRTHTRSRIW